MSRERAITKAEAYFDSGEFADDLARRVAMATTSQDPSAADHLLHYLEAEMLPSLQRLGFSGEILDNLKRAARRSLSRNGSSPRPN